MSHPKANFAAAIAASGLGRPSIVADGAIHRFRCKGDSADSLNGWYVLRLTRRPDGAFGSWKTGLVQTWRDEDRAISEREQRELEQLAKQAQREEEARQRRRNASAAERAKAMMQRSRPADLRHPYLVAKEIEAHGARQLGDALLIPIRIGNTLTSIQRISPNGAKRFLPGGRIHGGHFVIADETRREELLICEGFATGASLHEEIGAAVYVAFNAGNLAAVARSVRRLHPRAEIVICGDDDRWTDGNPGATKARKAALEIGAKLLMPDFSGLDLSTRPTDFNDLYRLRRAAQGAVAA
jgi:putative DNA primase/helicase